MPDENVNEGTQDIAVHHRNFDRVRFSWRQVRDCVEGSNAIKRGNEVYLPMPSAMAFTSQSPSQGDSTSVQYTANREDYSPLFLPWWHPNPAYKAYLQRARFPDITANTLRGLVGVTTKTDPTFELPDSISYLEEDATADGMTLVELYEFCISEVLQTGKLSLVLDVRRNDNTVYIAPYKAEDNINWRVDFINGKTIQTKSVFLETAKDEDVNQPLDEKHVKYSFELEEESGLHIATVQHFFNSAPIENPMPLVLQGNTLDKLPIVNIGSHKNDPYPDNLPILGISDISVAIYRKDADLSHAQFLTCNPSLIISGIDEDQAPTIVGSSVSIILPPEGAKAYYTKTDTSALNNLASTIKDLFGEAAELGASLIGLSKNVAESAETISLREAGNAVNLVSIVNHVSSAIKEILQMAADWTGSGGEVEFQGSIEFAEIRLSPQAVTSLTGSWMQGGISHETLLDRFRDADIVDAEISNEDEMERIRVGQENTLPENGNTANSTQPTGDASSTEEDGEQQAEDENDGI